MMKAIEENKIVERFQHSAPVDVTALAEALGITVWENEELPANVLGKICQDDNSGASEFTVAHEIAHFLLHRDRIGSSLTDDQMYSSGLSTQEEVAANSLAADILMPRPLLAEHIKKWGTDVCVLARFFKLSEAAMRIRLGFK